MAWASSEADQIAYLTEADLWQRGIDNDKANSVMVPYGYDVKLFDGSSFDGYLTTVKSPTWADDSNLRMKCINLDDHSKDKMASAQVYRDGAFGSARGYWVGSTHTTSQKWTIHYGWSSEYSEEQAKTQQYNLSYSMEMGIKFGEDFESS